MLALIIVIVSICIIALVISIAYYRQQPCGIEKDENSDPVTITDSRDFRVVFTCTSPLTEMYRAHRIIEKLLQSTVEADHVYIHVPTTCRRTQENYIIPKELILLAQKHKQRFTINRCKDLGPLTGFIPVLALEPLPDTLIITAGMNDEYHVESYHEELVKQALNNSKQAFGYRSHMNLLLSAHGAIYRRKFFSDTYANQQHNNHQHQHAYDIWLTFVLQQQNIPWKVIDR